MSLPWRDLARGKYEQLRNAIPQALRMGKVWGSDNEQSRTQRQQQSRHGSSGLLVRTAARDLAVRTRIRDPW